MAKTDVFLYQRGKRYIYVSIVYTKLIFFFKFEIITTTSLMTRIDAVNRHGYKFYRRRWHV